MSVKIPGLMTLDNNRSTSPTLPGLATGCWTASATSTSWR